MSSSSAIILGNNAAVHDWKIPVTEIEQVLDEYKHQSETLRNLYKSFDNTGEMGLPVLVNVQHHRKENDVWDEYLQANNPFSGRIIIQEFHAADEEDEWDDYETVNDPASGKVVPNEGHASDNEDDEWDDYETVNDPASGKVVPNEGHATP